MKKIVAMGMVVLTSLMVHAQSFRRGDAVEYSVQAGANKWFRGRIVEVNKAEKCYVVRGEDQQNYQIQFSKEETGIRRPVEALTAKMAMIPERNSTSSLETLKEKVKEEFESDFRDYDSVSLVYNSIEPQKAIRNTDPDFGKPDTDIYPFTVDLTVRLVTIGKDGQARRLNWQFKRKYLLFQGRTGIWQITVAEKDENLVTTI